MFVCLGCLSLGAAEAKTSVMTGSGDIVDGDVVEARNDAIIAAKKKIVEEGVDELISSDQGRENYSILSERLYSKYDRFLKNFELVSEEQSATQLTVSVRAAVDVERIRRELVAIGLLKSTQVAIPRVATLIAIQAPGVAKKTDARLGPMINRNAFQFDVAFRDELKKAAFLVVSDDKLMADLFPSGGADDEPLSAALLSILQKIGANFVVLGRLWVDREQSTDKDETGHLAVATAKLKIYQVGSGRSLIAIEERETKRDSDTGFAAETAVETIARSAAQQAMVVMLKEWDRGRTVDGVRLTVAGIQEYQEVDGIRKQLVADPMFSSVTEYQLGKRSVTFELQTRLSATEVGKRLAEMRKQHYNFIIQSTTDRLVSCVLVRKR